jgi:hypothetical protein
VAIQPLKDINAGKRPEEMAVMGEANCDFVEALVLGWVRRRAEGSGWE